MTDAPAGVPPAPLTHREIVSVLSGVMLGMFLAGLDNSIVATALPTIARELDGVAYMAWIVSAYQVCATISAPIYGKMSDLFGRKRLLQIALAVFGLASIGCALAQSMPQLIAARALQGLGGGGLIAMAHATIGDVLAPRDRGRYAGYIASTFAVSGLAGPILGGLFTDYLTWRLVFWINVPIVAVAWLVAQRALRKLSVRKDEVAIDYGGALLLAAAVVQLMLVAAWGGVAMPWTSPTIVTLALSGFVFAALFVMREMVAREPILPPRMFASREFSLLIGVAILAPTATMSAVVLLPIYLQLVTGASASEAGLFLIAMTGSMVIGSFLSGRIISSTGYYRRLPVVGFTLQAIGFWLLAGVTPDTPRALAALYTAFVGLGSSNVMSSVTVAAQNAVEPRDLGAGSASANFFRSLGGAFGVALLTTLVLAQLAINLALIPGIDKLGDEPSLALLRGGAAATAGLDAPIRDQIADAADAAFAFVFRIAAAIALCGAVLALCLRGLPLRTKPARHFTQTDAADGPRA